MKKIYKILKKSREIFKISESLEGRLLPLLVRGYRPVKKYHAHESDIHERLFVFAIEWYGERWLKLDISCY